MDSASFFDSIGVENFKTASADIVDLLLHKFSACAVQSFYKGQACGTFGDTSI